MSDLPMLERSDLICIWPIFAETNRSEAVRLVRAALRGEPCRVTPAEVARIQELARLAISRAPACRRIRRLDQPQEAIR